MINKAFTGLGVALVTPFDENHNVDYDSLENLVNHVIEGGVDFIVALGTTAETATLTEAEKENVVKTIALINNERVPIMLGLGGNNTMKIIEELQSLNYIKFCQSILSVTPYYNKPNQKGLYEHFRLIADASPLPICLYNVPSRTGVNMTADTILKLEKDCSNIFALKEAAGDILQANTLVTNTSDDFVLLSGDDSLTQPLMSIGFKGLISVGANAYPTLFSNLMKNIQQEDFKTAQSFHNKVTSICTLLFEEGNPTGIKSALHSMGVIKHNILRLPLVPASDNLYNRIKAFPIS